MRSVLITAAATSLAGLAAAQDFGSPAFDSADNNLEGKDPSQSTLATTGPAPLGDVAFLRGQFTGHGFNNVFRPNNAINGARNGRDFPNAISPAPGTSTNENVLEINLTQENFTFGNPLGNVPNRGLFNQSDIFLNGVPYLQIVNDVTNPATGKFDGSPVTIHFEPGLFMSVPATKNNPVLGQSINRMGSIPHGVTINAQALNPTSSQQGAPTFPKLNIHPFPIGDLSQRFPFDSLIASSTNSSRLPQDLSKFIAAGTVTQAILDDPNTILKGHNVGKNITSFRTFTVSTLPVAPFTNGSTAMIDFLGGGPKGQAFANAVVPQMNATFWIENVAWKITVPAMKSGTKQNIQPALPFPGCLDIPTFAVTAPKDINSPTNITVNALQIQYSQFIMFNFDALSWPHIALNTLTPAAPINVPASAFN